MIALLLSALLAVLGVEVGLASVYGTPGDRWSGDVTASGQPTGDGIAHRSLPLGHRVTVCRLDRLPRLRCVRTRVWDRGPYGLERIDGGPGWRVAPRVDGVRQPVPGWRWRGIADLSPVVAGELGMSSGLRLVVVLP